MIDILDLLHVTPRLWDAATLFHPKGSYAAERFVRERVMRILHGEVDGVVRGLRRMGTTQGVRGNQTDQVAEDLRILGKEPPSYALRRIPGLWLSDRQRRD